jgi:hypothetical protein
VGKLIDVGVMLMWHDDGNVGANGPVKSSND